MNVCGEEGPSLRRTLHPFTLLRLVLALVLLIAGSLKLVPSKSDAVSGELAIISPRNSTALAVFELGFGAWLLSGRCSGPTRRAALACFAAFAGIALASALNGHHSCGCFGKLSLHPALAFAGDAAAVFALLRSSPGGVGGPLKGMLGISIREGLIAVAIATISFSTFNAFERKAAMSADGSILGQEHLVVLDPESWVGNRFPLLEHIDVGAGLEPGRWIVLLFHHDCPACTKALPVYQRMARSGRRRVALVEVPPYGPHPAEPGASTPWVTGKLSAAREWMVSTPVEISLNDGIVTAVHLKNGDEVGEAH